MLSASACAAKAWMRPCTRLSDGPRIRNMAHVRLWCVKGPWKACVPAQRLRERSQAANARAMATDSLPGRGSVAAGATPGAMSTDTDDACSDADVETASEAGLVWGIDEKAIMDAVMAARGLDRHGGDGDAARDSVGTPAGFARALLKQRRRHFEQGITRIVPPPCCSGVSRPQSRTHWTTSTNPRGSRTSRWPPSAQRTLLKHPL